MVLTELTWYPWAEWIMLSIAEHRHVYMAMETGKLPNELIIPEFSWWDTSEWEVDPRTNEPINPGRDIANESLIYNPKYNTRDGEKRCEDDVKDVRRALATFEIAKSKVMGFIVRHVGDSIRSKLQNCMKNPSYEEAVNNMDVIEMWKSMRTITTGTADLSFNQEMKELIGMRMKGSDWAAHFTRFKRCRRRIENRRLTDAEFKD